MTDRIFLSYTGQDRGLVTAVRRLLGASDAAVFQDCESIRLGSQWRTAIGAALADVSLVYVFWCRHSSRSVQVRREWEAAVEGGKAVVPVLLDRTPLSEEG